MYSIYKTMTNANLATDFAEVDGRITCRVTSTNDHDSLVPVTIGVSEIKQSPRYSVRTARRLSKFK